MQYKYPYMCREIIYIMLIYLCHSCIFDSIECKWWTPLVYGINLLYRFILIGISEATSTHKGN